MISETDTDGEMSRNPTATVPGVCVLCSTDREREKQRGLREDEREWNAMDRAQQQTSDELKRTGEEKREWECVKRENGERARTAGYDKEWL